MQQLISVLPLLISLILCVVNVYAMNSYRLSIRHPFLLFSAVSVLCFGVNAWIILSRGSAFFRSVMIWTIAVPYFLLFLLITRDKLSQTFFNFWLWVNIYAVIHNLSMFVSDLTFRTLPFENSLRILLLALYLVLYQKVLKKYHRQILETPDVNWWVFSLIPLAFEVLLVLSHKVARVPEGFSRNYGLLLVIFTLMLLIYVLIIYTFRKTNAALRAEYAGAIYSQQLEAARTQIGFLNDAQIRTAVYRHDMRHDLMTIDGFLAIENVEKARAYIQAVQQGIDSLTLRSFCENSMVNLLCSAFADKAERAGVRLTVDIKLPEHLVLSDTDLCALLSNGLENALHAVSGLEPDRRQIDIYSGLRQDNLLIRICNPYDGDIRIRDGLPESDLEGHHYGCRSIHLIAERNHGICLFEAENGIFTLKVALPLSEKE